jgi:peptidyl-prolyl cis-trans isomerase C
MTCALHAPNLPQPKLVSVNGTVIARQAIAREVQHHPASKPVEAWQAAVRALVVRELLLQEARRLGVPAKPHADADGRRETEEEALIRAVHEREVTTPEPDVETCRRYYQQNRKAFRSAPLYEAAHILFAARRDQPAAFAQARAIATAVLAELAQAPHRFGEFAKLHSACPSAAHDGNLGQIGAGQTTPEFEQALTALAPGAMSRQPVESRYGFHIIRLDRKIEGRELPFELVAGRIADYLRDSVARRATAQYLARLVSRAEIRGIELAGAEAHRVN